MRYCNKCNILHPEQQSLNSQCSETKPSQKAIKREYFGRYRYGRQTTRSPLRREQQPDLWPNERCGVCEYGSQTVCQIGKE